MLKTLLYSTLTVVGVIAALISPVAGAVAVIESYFFHPIVFNPDFATYRPQFWISLAFIAGLFLHGARPAPRFRSEGILLWSLALYGLLALASSTWAVARPGLAYTKAFDLCKTILITVLLLRAISTERAMRIAIWACLVGAAHGAFMHTIGANLHWVPARFSREYGVVPDLQGAVMVFFVPLFTLLAIYGRNWKEKLFCWAALPLVLDSIINTYQRAYFVALFAQAVGLVLVLPKRIVLRLAPVAVVGGLLVLFVFTPDTYWDWMSTISDYEEEGSAQSRLVIAEASWQMFQDFPQGVGYYNYMFVSPRYLPAEYLTTLPGEGQPVKAAHNSFFDVACCTGILGFLLFGFSFVGAVALLRRIRKAADRGNPSALDIYAMGLELGLYGWAIGGLFHSSHENDPAFWTVAFAITLTRLRFVPRDAEPDEMTWDVEESRSNGEAALEPVAVSGEDTPRQGEREFRS